MSVWSLAKGSSDDDDDDDKGANGSGPLPTPTPPAIAAVVGPPGLDGDQRELEEERDCLDLASISFRRTESMTLAGETREVRFSGEGETGGGRHLASE